MVPGVPLVRVVHCLWYTLLFQKVRIIHSGAPDDGDNPHHKAEALCKALARSLRDALEPDPRAISQILSTKAGNFSLPQHLEPAEPPLVNGGFTEQGAGITLTLLT